jgi:hypothetical protein
MSTEDQVKVATPLRMTAGIFTPEGVVDPRSLATASGMVKTGLMYADRVQLMSHDGAVSLAIALADPQGPVQVTPGFEAQAGEVLRVHTDNDVYRAVQRRLVDWSEGFSRQDEATFFIESVITAVSTPFSHVR